MAARSWKKDTAAERIDAKVKALPIKDVEIKEYVRDTDLTNLPPKVAYRLDGVHLYADLLNMSEMLHVTDVEGETCHRRTLRFLNLHYRAVDRILQQVDAIFVRRPVPTSRTRQGVHGVDAAFPAPGQQTSSGRFPAPGLRIEKSFS